MRTGSRVKRSKAERSSGGRRRQAWPPVRLSPAQSPSQGGISGEDGGFAIAGRALEQRQLIGERGGTMPNILLVDDDPGIRDLVSDFLSKHG